MKSFKDGDSPRSTAPPQKRGGARPNAGRKPRTNTSVNLWVSFEEPTVTLLGGKKKLRTLIRNYVQALEIDAHAKFMQK